jgi:hypothetical protein
LFSWHSSAVFEFAEKDVAMAPSGKVQGMAGQRAGAASGEKEMAIWMRLLQTFISQDQHRARTAHCLMHAKGDASGCEKFQARI